MKFISIISAFLVSVIVFAEEPSIGFGKERVPAVNPQSVVFPEAIPVDQKPESTNAIDPIGMLLDEMRTQYEKDLPLAVKPVATGYLNKLAALEKFLSDNRRFDDAEIVKKYSDYIKAKYIDMVADVPPMPDISKVKELVELEKQFVAYSQKATKPVTEAYTKKLDAESVKCAKNKDYKSAKMFQEEMKNVNGPVVSNRVSPVAPFVGKWQSMTDPWSRVIQPNGVVILFQGDRKHEDRTWKLNGKVYEEFLLSGEMNVVGSYVEKDVIVLQQTSKPGEPEGKSYTYKLVKNSPVFQENPFAGIWVSGEMRREILPNGMVKLGSVNGLNTSFRFLKILNGQLGEYSDKNEFCHRVTMIDENTIVYESDKDRSRFIFKRVK